MSTPPTAAHRTNRVAIVVFWAYVLIPLAWGVVNTLRQALKLFG
ncbi:oxalate:formate antiporter [Trinickia symbiotica]|uniref:Oxalate:formate antiporter n=1 Tax=Trinickia symbiotica TaxID=863227 RepID=A0A2T3XM87_9BURK|nr:oxalate:formate antiporter [Trinickia symbiotica]PTB17618.1 oxalate:formate antiporter [Trinickia symbiotica]